MDARSDKERSPVKNIATGEIATPSDREIVITRNFDAPRAVRLRGLDEGRTRQHIGGTRAASPSRFAKSTSGRTEPFVGSIALPTVARDTRSRASIAKSPRQKGSSSVRMLPARALHAHKCVFDEKTLEYTKLLLAFIRTAHYWTEIHPVGRQNSDLSVESRR